LQGTREFKYDFLNQNNLKSLKWNLLNFTSPNYFFVNKNFEGINEYEEYFDVSKLFLINSVGVVTSCDDKVLAENKEDLKVKISKYFEEEEFKNDKVLNYLYRPFEIKKIYFEPKYLGRSREQIMQHYKKKNVGLIISKQFGGHKQFILFITNSINDKSSQPFAPYYNHPLYLYPDTNGQQTIGQNNHSGFQPPLQNGGEFRTPNLNTEIVQQIADKLGLTFVPEKNSSPLEGRCPEDGGVKKEYNQISNLPYLKTFRKELRNNLTAAEASLWKLLQGKKLEGKKFRRQHSVGNYILDFYCPTERIAIELDGQGHFETQQAIYDQERDLFLKYYGIRVLRFENKEVWNNSESLLEKVKSYFGKQTQGLYNSKNNETEPLSPTDSSPLQEEQLYEFAPIDILDYIYAVLHSPTYRDKYKEFLKIDFPRVPYPKDKKTFWKLVELGAELRQIHLLESDVVENYITQYPIDGDNVVIKPRFVIANEMKQSQEENKTASYLAVTGNVYINDSQYFANVPEVAWNFYIGGYQPAQKWLKDRKDRTLDVDDILHYQKIIVALFETDRLMKEIDKINIE
jgi:very-short-patch-repair endonuclease